MAVGAAVWGERDSEYLKEYLFRIFMAGPVAYPTASEPDHANFDNEHVAVIRQPPHVLQV